MKNLFQVSLAAALLAAGSSVFGAPFHGWNGRNPLLPPAKVEVSPDGGRGWRPETRVPSEDKPFIVAKTIIDVAMVDDIPGRPGRPGHGGWH